MNKKGFTLAEVLITLVIIGIVAAMTVPAIVANSNEKAIKSALKKNASVIQQALLKYYADNGEHVTVAIKIGNGYTGNSQNLGEEFFYKYFNLAKKCNGSNCSFGKDIKYKNYSGTSTAFAYNPDSYGGIILSDGTYIFWGSLSVGYGTAWANLTVDVNGAKGPNRLGKDTFLFQLRMNGELIPGGDPRSHISEQTYCNKTNRHTQNGYGCTAKMLREN